MPGPNPISNERLRTRAGQVSLLTNAGLSVVKFAGAGLTGSVSLLSEAFHSLIDLLASLVVVGSLRAAAAPPDEDHPYGHAKIEAVTGLGEACLLIALGCGIAIEAVRHIATKTELREPLIGVVLAAGSAIVSKAAGLYVGKVGRQTSSPALMANGAHLDSDFYTSLGVFASLVLVKLTGLGWIDAVVAIALAAILMVAGGRNANFAFQQLIDRRLPDEDLNRIREIVGQGVGVISMHRLRTRLSGEVRYIDFHVVVPVDWSVVQAHNLVDAIEDALEAALAPAIVVIHVDPYDAEKAAKGRAQSRARAN
jgi:cation diffusion facilitator family transporter